MVLSVNGHNRTVQEGATISELLRLLKIRGESVAVEVNREIIARARHASHRLREGDAVEIVTFVGGG